MPAAPRGAGERRVSTSGLQARATTQERPVPAEAQRGVEQGDAGQVPPVEILDQDEQRARLALGAGPDPPQARRIWSPMADGVAAGGAQLDEVASREAGGVAAHLAEERGALRWAVAVGRAPAGEGEELGGAALRAGSPSRRPAARRSTSEASAKAEPARRGSPCAVHTSMAPPRSSSTRRRSSWPRRDFPAPAGAITSTARAPGSSTQAESMASRVPSSRSRPTQGVGLPRSRRAPHGLRRPRSESVAPTRSTAKVRRRGRRCRARGHLVDPDPAGPGAAAGDHLRRAIDDGAHRQRPAELGAPGRQREGAPPRAIAPSARAHEAARAAWVGRRPAFLRAAPRSSRRGAAPAARRRRASARASAGSGPPRRWAA